MSIQSQLNAAASGAVVVIAPGVYRENVTITKPVGQQAICWRTVSQTHARPKTTAVDST